MRERILRELSAVQAANVSLEARARTWSAPTPSWSSSPTWRRTTCRSRCARWPASASCSQRRYVGQLDERADQYIEYAVDGAKRMQALINDLLAFSRVGRIERDGPGVLRQRAVPGPGEPRPARSGEQARVIETAELPTVRAEFSLLTSLFQNLIGNAIKFRGDRPPVVTISAARQDDGIWLFSVADNGIGIEPRVRRPHLRDLPAPA